MVNGSADAEVLLELPRGETEKLCLSRRSYNGKPFLDLRIYFRGSDGEWHPTRKGTSLRIGELASIAAAIDKGLSRIVDQECARR